MEKKTKKTLVMKRRGPKCFLDLKSDNFEPKYITTDPDSSAYRAATELHAENIFKTDPECQIDTFRRKSMKVHKKKACCFRNDARFDKILPRKFAE